MEDAILFLPPKGGVEYKPLKGGNSENKGSLGSLDIYPLWSISLATFSPLRNIPPKMGPMRGSP